MTGEQSRKLKVGDKVCWQNDQADRGTVTETSWSGLTIKWDSRGEQRVLHNDRRNVSSFKEVNLTRTPHDDDGDISQHL
jgi:hypothetical protein